MTAYRDRMLAGEYNANKTTQSTTKAKRSATTRAKRSTTTTKRSSK